MTRGSRPTPSRSSGHEDVTVLRVSWPLGAADAARASGYSSALGELWVARADEDTIAYVVTNGGHQVEAWPRTTSPIGCD